MILNTEWDKYLAVEFEKPYFKDLWQEVYPDKPRYKTLPDKSEVFKAYNLTDLNAVKVVIVGQDPYPTPGNANGLAFSVNKGVSIPASLANIFKEVCSEYPEIPYPKHGYLGYWAEQGVFLLNTVLTVPTGNPRGHRGYDWEKFTRKTIETISEKRDNVIWMLWGNDAKCCVDYVHNPTHSLLFTSHPSPLSAYRGFIGCCQFKQVNSMLQLKGYSAIDWSVPD